jgi:O-antigen ligase
MSAFANALSIPADASNKVRYGAVAAMVLLGTAWGAFVAISGLSAALICLAAIVCVFTVRDFRVGVLVMILIVPVASSYLFPRAMFGVTGLNPLNVLMVGTFASFLLLAMPNGSIRRFAPLWIIPVYVAPIVFAGINGLGHVSLIPPIFILEEQIDFKNDIGYIRDSVVKPLILVFYALMVSAAYARSRNSDKMLTPAILSMWIMGLMVIGYFLASDLHFGQLASEYARTFFSPLGMHANDLGRLYATAYAILLFTWDRTQRPVMKTMLFLTMGLVFVALVLTFSRAAIIGFVLVNIWYLCARPTRRNLLLAALALPIALILTPGAIWYRLEMGADAGAAGMSAGRVSDIWTPLIPEILDRPFFGHGLSSVLWARPMRMNEMMDVTHPHSAYLGALLDFGAIGAILLIAFWFTVWRGFRKLAKDPLLPPHEQGFFEGASVALVSFAAAGFVGSSWTPVPEQSFLWLAIGLMFGVQTKRQMEQDAARRAGRAY